MVNRLIEKPINIYTFPTEFEEPAPVVAIGDLHGNAAKLLHFLLRHRIVKFKEGVDPAGTYEAFISLYEENARHCKPYLEYRAELVRLDNEMAEIDQQIAEKNAGLAVITTRIARSIVERQIEAHKAQRDSKQRQRSRTIELYKALIPDIKRDLTTNIAAFNDVMTKLEIDDPKPLLQIIGDEVGDRGSNDYFILKIFEFLRSNNVKDSKLISNHGKEFIVAYEHMARGEPFEPDKILDIQKTSVLGLKLLLEIEVIGRDEIARIVDTVYKPTLKILDYALDDDGISLFSHAPIGFGVIKQLANRMGVVYRDGTKEALAATTDKINSKFAVVVKENRVHELFDDNSVIVEHMTAAQIAKSPLTHIIWNRWNEHKEDAELRPESVKGYNVRYVHGHDGFSSEHSHIKNLDNDSGKYSRAQIAESPVIRAYLDEANCDEKILVLSGRKLNPRHDPALIDLEYRQSQMNNRTTRLVAGCLMVLGLGVGALIGSALIGTGIFAIIGIAILGGIIAASIGVGLTKMTEPSPIDTLEGKAQQQLNTTYKDLVNLGFACRASARVAPLEPPHHPSPLASKGTVAVRDDVPALAPIAPTADPVA